MDTYLQAAAWRWLKPFEVWQCLTSWAAVPETTAFPSPPTSGQLFFLQKSRFRSWKKDGHSYRKRKSEQGIREDRDKYTQGGETIQCVYTHGAGVCPKCRSATLNPCARCGHQGVTPVTFHRRAYWKVAAPENILVHYLNEREEQLSEEETCSDTHSTAGTEELSCSVDIQDYSPEWDTVEGGSKVLICVDPPLGQKTDIHCYFGDISTQCTLIQAGVIRCYAPAHSPGHVDLYLSISGRDVTRTRRSFEFRDLNRKRSSEAETANWWDLTETEFKVRLVERLESLSKEPESTVQEYLSDDVFENLVTTILKRAIKGKTNINGLDKHGFALVHYLAALNYWKSLQVFEQENVSVHIASAAGVTALDVAQHFQHHNCVSVLLMCEADPADDHNLQEQLTTERSFTEELKARQTEEAFIEKVQTIQKNVRMWAIRKHYCGLKNATMTLQRYIRSLLLRRQFQDQRKAAITIQKTVRNWLQGAHFTP